MDISHIVPQDIVPAYIEEETVIQLSLIHIILCMQMYLSAFFEHTYGALNTSKEVADQHLSSCWRWMH